MILFVCFCHIAIEEVFAKKYGIGSNNAEQVGLFDAKEYKKSASQDYASVQYKAKLHFCIVEAFLTP